MLKDVSDDTCGTTPGLLPSVYTAPIARKKLPVASVVVKVAAVADVLVKRCEELTARLGADPKFHPVIP